MTRETLEAKPWNTRFGGVYVETYRGYKIRVQRGQDWGTLRVFIAGELVSVPTGYTNRDVALQAASARLYIDDSYKRPDAYTWSRAS